MKQHPILFSTPMVQAILKGRKTQTRRVVKPQPPGDAHYFLFLNDQPHWVKRKIHNTWTYFVDPEHGSFPCNDSQNLKCPYGQPGDVLWVRETMILNKNSNTYWPVADGYIKTADYEKKIPSIHTPKTAARIWLEIEDVKVERLQDISEEGAYREGIESDGLMVHCEVCKNGAHNGGDLICEDGFFYTARSSFQSLWHSINGTGSWDSNPWVWVVKFKVLSTTGMKQSN